MNQNELILFQGKKIRRTWHNKEWCFVLEDIIAVLSDSKDPKQYIQKMKQRDLPLAEGWVQIVHTHEIETLGGKQKMNCVNPEGAFRIIQSIPSPKAEPFKIWLAKVGYERVQEIRNPEIAMKRMKEIYKAKGYSNEWIEKRTRGIAVRDELTEEWSKRGIKAQKEYSILTSEISKATFDLTPKEYKKVKGLKKQNLRDHMNDLELIFSMLGEKATTEIARNKDSQGFSENRESSRKGGKIAGNARKNLEKETGKKVVMQENYLGKTEKAKKLEERKK
ncbi:Bro-N domain-containing protein [Candidatus Micrarchaeota archaeon]|nr:Bro-N domain-containing protein [Candidatus Micrarchaeota archaeon]MBU2476846.1 Bro-N domain-containing protein [Candidatus Micrarchaeota archaeon]